MDKSYYHTKEFAQKATVSVRTLQFYDKKGLLSPSRYSDTGYRLYSDEDFVKLQRILALKYLGFSLSEIQTLSRGLQEQLGAALRVQKAMMLEKRAQIDTIIKAIEKIEGNEGDNGFDYDTIVKVIEVMQMDLKPEWVNKYLTKDERVTMRGLAKISFTEATLKKLVKQEYTEEIHQKFGYFRDELRRLVETHAEPGDEEAQNLARYLTELNHQRSQGDKEILAGMQKSWQNFNELPEEKKPQIYVLTDAERAFIKEACKIMYERKVADEHREDATKPSR